MGKISINLNDGSVRREQALSPIVGVDLGTTNSLIAFVKEGKPQCIRKGEGGSAIFPSVVYLDKSGEVQVGEVAKDKLITQPERTIYSVKRLMGKSYSDLSDAWQNQAYRIIEYDEEGLVRIQVDDRFYTPIELSAEILKSLKKIAEEYLATEVSRAVITVPAYFNDAQRQATRDAGKLAGLDVLRIVNEPTAASLAYDLGTSRIQDERIAVYDLGGGTFDISILHIQNGIFEVLATNGDTFLGGDDFDLAIMEYWIDQLGIDDNSLDKNKSLLQELRLQAEGAKKTLSTQASFTGEISGRQVHLHRSKFEEITTHLVQRTLDCCRLCLRDSGLTKEEIDQVIMVGGSTRIPLVKSSVSRFFNRPVHDRINPDEVVALGAAIQADILAGNRKDMLLLDITPLSLGIETVGGLMDIIVPRNTRVPTRAGRQYTTSVDGQKNLRISVYQGERDLVADNRKLGEFILHNLPPMAAGMPKIDIQFIVDADGILRVRARELRSNVETEIQIKSQYGISEKQMAEMLKASLEHASDDMAKRGLIEAKIEAETVILHSKKFIAQNEGLLSRKELVRFQKYLAALQEAVGAEDKDLINLRMQELNDYSSPLAQRALDHNISEALKGKEI